MEQEYRLTHIGSGTYIEKNVASEPTHNVAVLTYQLSPAAASTFMPLDESGTFEAIVATENEREVLAEEGVLKYLLLPYPGNNDGVIVNIIHSHDVPNILVVVVKRPLPQSDDNNRLQSGLNKGV